jgi:hypothetical protein
MANLHLIRKALMALLGRKAAEPLNLPESPRTLSGNRANTEHPDFDPGDFDGADTILQRHQDASMERGLARTDPEDLSPRDLEEIQALVGPVPAANLNNPGVDVLIRTIEGQIEQGGSPNPALLRMLKERDPGMAQFFSRKMKKLIDLEHFDDKDFRF